MTWYILAVIGAILSAITYTFFKNLTKKMNSMVMGAGIFFVVALILTTVSLVNGMPNIKPLFYLATVASSLFIVAGLVLAFKSFSRGDLSLAFPMQAFTPLFLVITSWLLLRELPTLAGLGGIGLLAIGLYILNLNGSSHKILDPFKEVYKNKSAYLMLLSAFMFSITTNLDKLVVLNSDPFFGGATTSLLVSFWFLILSVHNHSASLQEYRKHIPIFILAGISLALEIIVINIAFTMQIVPYVISIKRTGIIFAVLFGLFILKEKHAINRIIGASIMVLGAATIIIFG